MNDNYKSRSSSRVQATINGLSPTKAQDQCCGPRSESDSNGDPVLDSSLLAEKKYLKKPLPDDWMQHLSAEFRKPYMERLRTFLKNEQSKGVIIYPPMVSLFRAFHLTRWDDLRVVILGQDPYHGPNQAHGLCFSVPNGIELPPSLKNIFQEIKNDLGLAPPSVGDLSFWARQGVLLLNTVLTVRANEAGSHRGQGWEIFTDQVIKTISEKKNHVVFILWGSFAQQKKELIDRSKHFVIESAHPSPLSAYRGFFGSRPFSKTNDQLVKWGLQPIKWVE